MTARRRGRTAAAPRVEVIVRSARWNRRPRAKTVVKTAISAAATAASTPPVELAIVLGDDSAIRALNRQWRGKNAPTNVLSFPAPNNGKQRCSPPYIGDVIIAYETTAREATAAGKPFDHHLAHLAIHGFLHLLGYDHTDVHAANRMEDLERRVLARLSVPDPYAPRRTRA
jgi:probable rRNA maturation factor